jgi:flagellar hook-length control protein FliK
MLAEFFRVAEQDSAPIDSPRHKYTKIGDTGGASIAGDTETPGGGDDFRSTFMEVSRRREEAVSEPQERSDPATREKDPSPDPPSETGTRSEVEGPGRQDERPLAEGVTRGQSAGDNDTDEASAREPGRKGGMPSDDASRGGNNAPEPDRPSTAAIAEQKDRSGSAGKETPTASIAAKNTSVNAAQNASAKGSLVFDRGSLQGGDSKGGQGIGRKNGTIHSEALTPRAQEVKGAISETKAKGVDMSAPESGRSGKGEGERGEATPKGNVHAGKHTILTGAGGKEALASVLERGSSKKTDGQAGTDIQKGGASTSKGVFDPQQIRPADQEGGKTGSKIPSNDLSGSKTVVPITGTVSPLGKGGAEKDSSVRGKKSLASLSKSNDQSGVKDGKGRASVSEKESLKMTGNQAEMRTQKGDASTSRGVFDPQQIRPADQEGGKTGLKISSNDLSGPKTVVPITGTVSLPGKGGAIKDSSATPKRGSASAQTPSESRKTEPRQGAAVTGSAEANKRRQGKDAPRFNLGRDGLGKQDPHKADSGKQRIENSGEKGKEEAAARFAHRVSSLASEQTFDRNAPKPETIGSDNATPSTGNSSSSARTSGNIIRLVETETVRRSFQENGVRQLVEKAVLNLKNGRQEFRIELKPESLGSVKLQVSTENHQVTIRIITELPIAKEMIENHMSHLRAELQGQGIEIDKCEVSLSDRADQEALDRRFSRSSNAGKARGARRGAKMVSPDPDAAWEDLARRGRAGNGVINLFA